MAPSTRPATSAPAMASGSASHCHHINPCGPSVRKARGSVSAAGSAAPVACAINGTIPARLDTEPVYRAASALL